MIRRQTEFNDVNLATAIFRLASQGGGACACQRTDLKDLYTWGSEPNV